MSPVAIEDITNGINKSPVEDITIVSFEVRGVFNLGGILEIDTNVVYIRFEIPYQSR
jgi:hypothetical protein